jgi:hypothetical protein
MTTAAFAPTSAPDATLEFLKNGIQDVLQEVHRLPIWQALTNPDTAPDLARLIMAEAYREIAFYQPDVIEATIAVIGMFPRSLPAKKVRAMLVHQAEEWDHGEMAARDLSHLGQAGTTTEMTPTAFATAAFWRMLAHKRMPFAYLGALYLFEGLTPLVSGGIKAHLQRQGFDRDSLEYIEFHSTEDIKHARLVDAVIRDVVAQYPDKAAEVRFGFECFRQVYPVPGWQAGYERAMANWRVLDPDEKCGDRSV